MVLHAIWSHARTWFPTTIVGGYREYGERVGGRDCEMEQKIGRPIGWWMRMRRIQADCQVAGATYRRVRRFAIKLEPNFPQVHALFREDLLVRLPDSTAKKTPAILQDLSVLFSYENSSRRSSIYAWLSRNLSKGFFVQCLYSIDTEICGNIFGRNAWFLEMT